MANNSPPQNRTEHSLFSNLGVGPVTGPVTAVILGGGFLLGILFGAFFLLGPTDEPAVAAKQASSPSEPDSDSVLKELTAERDRLRRELDAVKVRREVEALRNEMVSLKSSPVSVESASNFPTRRRNTESPATNRSAPRLPTTRSSAAPTIAPKSQGPATLVYWNQLNAVILQEAALRAAPVGGVNATNAGGFLDARIQAAEFASDAIGQLDTTGVDSRVAKLAEQLANWYAEGRQVAQSGKQLLTIASIQDRQGSAGNRYQDAERRHSQSVNKINADGEQTQHAMSRKYRLKFPPLN